MWYVFSGASPPSSSQGLSLHPQLAGCLRERKPAESKLSVPWEVLAATTGHRSTAQDPNLAVLRMALRTTTPTTRTTTTTTSAPRPRLDRRWSVESPRMREELSRVTVPDPREGYVFQLRQLHEAHQQQQGALTALTSMSGTMAEKYPGMISDERAGRLWHLGHEWPASTSSSGSASGPATNVVWSPGHPKRASSPTQFGSRLAVHSLSNRCRSSSMDLGLLSTSRVGGRQHPGSQEITVVPEDDNESLVGNTNNSDKSGGEAKTSKPRKLTAPPLTSSSKAIVFLRQRSSSLPRLLPAILDDDCHETQRCSTSLSVSDEVEEREHERQRRLQQSIVVAKEVQKFVCKNAADVAAILPMPIPTAFVRQNTKSSTQTSNETSVESAKALMMAVGKFHALMLGVHQMAPALYQDFILSLGLDSNNAIVGRAQRLLNKHSDLGADWSLVERQLRHLVSLKTSLPFALICHGDPRSLHTSTRLPSGQRLGHLTNAFVGSPLADIYLIVYDLLVHGQGHVGQMSDLATSSYFLSFSNTCRALRVDFKHLFSLQQLREDLDDHLVTGLIMAHLMDEQRRGGMPDIQLLSKLIAALRTPNEKLSH